jgi:hypothetical protein
MRAGCVKMQRVLRMFGWIWRSFLRFASWVSDPFEKSLKYLVCLLSNNEGPKSTPYFNLKFNSCLNLSQNAHPSNFNVVLDSACPWRHGAMLLTNVATGLTNSTAVRFPIIWFFPHKSKRMRFDQARNLHWWTCLFVRMQTSTASADWVPWPCSNQSTVAWRVLRLRLWLVICHLFSWNGDNSVGTTFVLHYLHYAIDAYTILNFLNFNWTNYQMIYNFLVFIISFFLFCRMCCIWDRLQKWWLCQRHQAV